MNEILKQASKQSELLSEVQNKIHSLTGIYIRIQVKPHAVGVKFNHTIVKAL